MNREDTKEFLYRYLEFKKFVENKVVIEGLSLINLNVAKGYLDNLLWLINESNRAHEKAMKKLLEEERGE